LRQEGTSSFVSLRITFFKKNAQETFSGGHTNTERGYLPTLAAKLRAELEMDEGKENGFKAAGIHISREDKHPLDFA
jgi:hypothetical protein